MLLLQGRTVAMEGLRTGDAVGDVDIWGRASCLLRAQQPAGPAGPAAAGLRPPAVRGEEGWGGGRGEIQSAENRTRAFMHDWLTIAQTKVT